MNLSQGTKTKALLAGLQSVDIKLKEHIDSLEEHFIVTEPQVHAFLAEKERFRRIRRESKKLAKLNGGSEKIPLFGIPVGIKDIFHVDGFQTRAGSRLPKNLLQGDEADSVKRLRKAGALIMGKTVTTEFAYFSPGPTRNPHNLEHTPGGSSSGSAAAVGAGIVPLAIGTQTIGSVIRPASFCGVVGFKPCYARISTEGVIPLSPFLDHVGTFSNSVWLTKIAAKVLIVNWRGKVTMKNRPILGIPGGDYLERADKKMLGHFWEKVEVLKRSGYVVRERNLFPDYEEIAARNSLILAAEAAIVHAEWFRFHSEKYHERTRQLIQSGMAISQDSLKKAREIAFKFGQRIRSLMEIHAIDLWMAPAAAGPAPKGLDSTGDPVMNMPWTQSGLPVLGLPTGKSAEGLPLGIQFIGDLGRDEELLEWGLDLEEIFQGAQA